MNLAETIQAMADAGVSAQQIAAFIAKIDAGKRARSAEKKRAQRARKDAMSPHVLGTTEDNSGQHGTSADPSFPASPLSPPPTPPPIIPPSPQPSGVLCAREADFRSEIVKLYEKRGLPTPATGGAVVWLAHGRDPAICLAVIDDLLERKGKSLPLSYFDGPIADAHVVKPASPQVRAPPSNGRRSPLMTAIAKIAGEIHERDSQTANVEIFSPGAGPSPDGYGGRLHGERYRA